MGWIANTALKYTLGIVGTRIIGGEPIVIGPTLATEVDALLRSLIAEVEREPPGPEEWPSTSAERPAS